MLNVIFVVKKALIPPEVVQALRDTTDFVEKVVEGREVNDGYKLYQVNFRTFDLITNTIDTLKSYDVNSTILGVWYLTGCQYAYELDSQQQVVRKQIFDEEIQQYVDMPILYPFDIVNYKKMLADIVTYDENGAPIDSRRPTIEEARSIQINLWAGQTPRDLNTYVF